MKLLVDMNLSPGWVDRLARHGFEAVHWSTIGAATAPDAEILTWANEHAFVLITNDLDFSAILAASGGASPSVVQIRTQTLLSHVVDAVLRDALRGVTPVTYWFPGATAPCGAIVIAVHDEVDPMRVEFSANAWPFSIEYSAALMVRHFPRRNGRPVRGGARKFPPRARRCRRV